MKIAIIWTVAVLLSIINVGMMVERQMELDLAVSDAEECEAELIDTEKLLDKVLGMGGVCIDRLKACEGEK